MEKKYKLYGFYEKIIKFLEKSFNSICFTLAEPSLSFCIAKQQSLKEKTDELLRKRSGNINSRRVGFFSLQPSIKKRTNY